MSDIEVAGFFILIAVGFFLAGYSIAMDRYRVPQFERGMEAMREIYERDKKPHA